MEREHGSELDEPQVDDILTDESDAADMERLLRLAAAEYLVASGQLTRRIRGAYNSDLTIQQFNVLMRIGSGVHGSTRNALAKAEFVQPQTMGETLASLDRRGLITRRRDPTDQRRLIFVLTEKGDEMRRAHWVAMRGWLKDAFDTLDPGEKLIMIAAVRVIRKLSES